MVHKLLKIEWPPIRLPTILRNLDPGFLFQSYWLINFTGMSNCGTEESLSRSLKIWVKVSAHLVSYARALFPLQMCVAKSHRDAVCSLQSNSCSNWAICFRDFPSHIRLNVPDTDFLLCNVLVSNDGFKILYVMLRKLSLLCSGLL